MPVKPEDYKMKVVIGIPFSGRYVPPEWAVALATLAWPMNCIHAFCPVKGLPREEARKEIVKTARRLKSQYVWMLDDDVELPREAPIELISALDQRPDYDFIAGICPSRSPRPEPMVFKPNLGAHWMWKFGEIFEIEEAATACMLFRTSIFDKVPEPWFRDLNTLEEELEDGIVKAEDMEEHMAYDGAMTDDIYFCRKAAKAGCRLLAHGGVICRHWGRNGDAYELPQDSYPFKKGKEVDIREALMIEGWMDSQELTWLAEQARNKTNIVEIGCWKGRSTRAMAENCEKGMVLVIDDFTGNGNDKTMTMAANKTPEEMFEIFRGNMMGVTNVHALREPSMKAIKMLPDMMTFDMIFIDADHRYEAVRDDIKHWKKKLTPGGLLCGHDYSWEGVKQAVSELLPEAKVAVGDIWYVNGH